MLEFYRRMMERPQRKVRLVYQGKHPVDIERKRDGSRKKAYTEGGYHKYKDNDSGQKEGSYPLTGTVKIDWGWS